MVETQNLQAEHLQAAEAEPPEPFAFEVGVLE